MTRFFILIFFLFCLSCSQGPKGPNILLITAETLRADHLPFHGYKHDTAPFLSSLQKDSVFFQNAYSTSSWTAPALASLVTGLYPKSHGVVHGLMSLDKITGQEVLPSSLETIGELLQDGGYRTYGVVANAHGDKKFGFGRGFDEYQCLGFFTPAEKVNVTVLKWKDEIETSTDPVFLWVHYFDPHAPYHMRKPWYQEYKGDSIYKDISWNMDQVTGLMTDVDPEKLRFAKCAYNSEIAYMDSRIQELFKAMPCLNKWPLVFSADHGEQFLEHGFTTHSMDLYNETTKVPLFIRPPDGQEPVTHTGAVSWVDLAPTLAAMAGLKIPSSWQGIPLVDQKMVLSSGLKKSRKVFTFLNRYEKDTVCLIDSQWKLIHNQTDNTYELYDLTKDPYEKKNLASMEKKRKEDLSRVLSKSLKNIPSPADPPETAEVDADLLNQMKQLGYGP